MKKKIVETTSTSLMVFGFFLLFGACGGSDSATITQSAMAVSMVSGIGSMVAGGLLARYYIKKECSGLQTVKRSKKIIQGNYKSKLGGLSNGTR